MNMKINVSLTYEQTKALVALGMTDLEIKLNEYNIVEDRIRSSIDIIYGFVDYINENIDSDFNDMLSEIIKECDKLFNHELANTYYFNDNFEQKERLVAIKHKSEFLITNPKEHNERNLRYPQKMYDLCRDFVIDLNKNKLT